jgi:hypothetical protein
VVLPEAEPAVTPDMLSGPLSFFVSPDNLTSAEPVPYGVANNTADQGWIWPNDNTGSLGSLVIDFGAPTALGKIRVFSTFPAGERGAVWLPFVTHFGQICARRCVTSGAFGP